MREREREREREGGGSEREERGKREREGERLTSNRSTPNSTSACSAVDEFAYGAMLLECVGGHHEEASKG